LDSDAEPVAAVEGLLISITPLTGGSGNVLIKAKIRLYSAVLQKAARSASVANASLALPLGLNKALLSSNQFAP
jgi:hypothetical protein